MSTGFTFGVKTSTAPVFGTTSTQNQSSFNSGIPTGLQGGLQFGINSSAPVSNLLGSQKIGVSGTPTVAGSTAFSFGTSQPATTSAQVAGLSFGGLGSTTVPTTTTVTPAPGLSFGIPASSASLSFGTIPTAAGTGSGIIGTTSAPIFGTTATPVSAQGGLNFGPSNTSTLGLGTSVVTSGSREIGFGISTAAIASVTGLNFGLGGLATSQAKAGTAVTTQKDVSPKEQPLPNEILQTVEEFKEMVKQQKLHSSDIARCSVRDFRKVEQEIDLLSTILLNVANQLEKNRYLAEKLKYDTAKCLQNVEMAQRTQDTPPGLQYENTAPLKYFLELADQFEHEMQRLKIQIEGADKYVKNNRNPDALRSQDLALGMKRLHEIFVALAGRLQSVHSQVESQKEIYLNIRKQICNDHTNPFEKQFKPTEFSNLKNNLIYSPPKVATGPTPFSNLALGNGNPLMLQQNQPTTSRVSHSISGSSGLANTMTFGSKIGNQATNASLFGTTPFGQSSFNTSSNFQLQKPFKRAK